MTTRWLCKICRMWGVGGAQAWTKHYEVQHNSRERFSASQSFGVLIAELREEALRQKP